jgi:diadenylate cyclase
MAKTSNYHIELIKAAVSLASKRTFDHLLYVGDMLLPEEVFRGKSVAKKKLIQAVVSEAQRAVVEAAGVRMIPLPQYDLGRAEKLKLSLVSGIARGLFEEGDVVVALLSGRPVGKPDSILIVTVGPDDEAVGFGFLRADGVSPEILEALIDLAVMIGVEGWEGRPVGSLFVIGDSNKVMEQSRPLSLNPFQGYSEDERNMLNPEVKRALRAFAVLDGAFVLREDGVVLAAGRYLNFEEKDVRIPLGLGSRHMAAAGITHETDATAVVISQTSGTVRVFRHGRAVMELASRTRRP